MTPRSALRLAVNLLILSFSLVLLLASFRDPGPGKQALIYDLQYQETNRISIPLTNFGQFGQNVAGSAGDDWPKGSGNAYIFGAGIWVAGILDNDTIVINGYNTVGSGQEFMPGPHFDPNRPEDKLYFSSNPDDLANWPDTTSAGDPIVISDEDTWGIYNGHDPAVQGAGEYPLPITVTRHSLAWNSPFSCDMIFFLYTITNDTTIPLDNMYVGIGCDMDVGDADNDLVGLDRRRSLGYTFTAVQEAGWLAPPPYYIGLRMLYAPKASDTVYVGQDPFNPDTTIYPGEHLVLTAFKKFTRNIDANNDIERYLVMAGYDFNYVYGPFSDSLDADPSDKRMVISAGPFSLDPGETDTMCVVVLYSNGDTGGLSYLQDEADYAQSFWDEGFNFHNVEVISPNGGEVWSGVNDILWSTSSSSGDTLVIDIAVSPVGGGSLDTIAVGELDDSVYTWNTSTVLDGFYFLRIGADDGLLWGHDWSDGEFVIDNPGNGPPDVGLLSPNGGEVWSGVHDITWWARDPEGDTLTVDLFCSNDNGITWMDIVTGEPNDGAYTWDTSTFPNGVVSCLVRIMVKDSSLSDEDLSSRPFTLDNSHAPGGNVQHAAGSCNTITITVLVVRPGEVTGDLYELRFGTICPHPTDSNAAVYTYDVWNLTQGSLILDDYSLSVPLNATPTVSYSPLFDGISLKIEATIGSSTFSSDSIRVTSDPGVPYPEGNLTVEGIAPEKRWAFHGATSFEIRWEYYNGSPDTLTAQIYDVGNDSEVPFDTLWWDSWSFGPRSLVPPIVYQGYLTEDHGVSRTMVYVCGVQYYTNAGLPMDWSVRPEPGEIWTVYGSGDCVPCRGNIYRFSATGIYESTKASVPSVFRLSQNRPNPFAGATCIQYSIITSEDREDSKVSLRVYDVAGRLVKTLVDGELKPGWYTVTWDGVDEKGQPVSSGVYYCRLVGGEEVTTRKMVLVK